MDAGTRKMTKTHITKVTNFCIALVTLNRKQRIAILHELDRYQLPIIREICLNILVNKELSFTDNEKVYFNHNLGKLRILGSRSASKHTKIKIIVKSQQLLKKVATISVRYLTKTS